MTWLRRNLLLFAKIAATLLFGLIATNVLANEFATLALEEVIESLGHIGWWEILAAVLATCAAFAAVASYDGFALHYAGRSLNLRRSAMSSTTTYAISNLLGFPVFTGNALRLWLYGHWGLGAAEVMIAALVTTVVCNLALAMIAGASLIAAPQAFAEIFAMSSWIVMILGLALLLIAVAFAGVGIAGPRRFRLWMIDYNRPGLALIPHMLFCLIDFTATAAVLYVLLNHTLSIDFLFFLALFSTAKTIGILSNVPGGLGVFEAMIAIALNDVSPADLASALIGYRCIFYLAPFAVAAAFVTVHGLRRASRRTSPREPSTPSMQKTGD